MSSLNLRDITLSQMNLTRSRKGSVMAVDARPRYKINPETRTRTDEIEGFNVDVLCMGKAQTVKLPKEVEQTFAKVQEALKEGKTVYVGFNGTLRAKPYALLNNGQLVSGISATASTLVLEEVIEEQDDMLDFENDIIV